MIDCFFLISLVTFMCHCSHLLFGLIVKKIHTYIAHIFTYFFRLHGYPHKDVLRDGYGLSIASKKKNIKTLICIATHVSNYHKRFLTHC